MRSAGANACLPNLSYDPRFNLRDAQYFRSTRCCQRNSLKLLAVSSELEFQCEILRVYVIYVTIICTLKCQAAFNNLYKRRSY